MDTKGTVVAGAATVALGAAAVALASSDLMKKIASDVGDIAVECVRNAALQLQYGSEKETSNGVILVSTAGGGEKLRGKEKEVEAMFNSISAVASAVYVAEDNNRPAGVEVTFKQPSAAAMVIKSPPPKGWKIGEMPVSVSRGPFQGGAGGGVFGGGMVADALKAQGVKFVFTLTGGHISPMLVGCKMRGIRVVDVRHEVTTVFAADAVARLTGIPGVAMVTAGPGLTNTITAVKNAQLAQSPLVVFGGASATLLRGRGSLQDIDQLALMGPHVKWAASLSSTRDIYPMIAKAFEVAKSGVPGPVFIEVPLDLIWPEDEAWSYFGRMPPAKNLIQKVSNWFLRSHIEANFIGSRAAKSPSKASAPSVTLPKDSDVAKVASMLKKAQKPVILVGSQSLLAPERVKELVDAVNGIGCPVFLAGMARGLLGENSSIQVRHKRRDALKEADFVLLMGVPLDFRLDYGRHVGGRAKLVSVNRDSKELLKNWIFRMLNVNIEADPFHFLLRLARTNFAPDKWSTWLGHLKERDNKREEGIAKQAEAETKRLQEGSINLLNPIRSLQILEKKMPANTLLVADGGDYVGTAAYTLRPRGPLTWMDPGVFGTLGVGAGFALGAKLCRPDMEVIIIYGDGSSGYSLNEMDTFKRHGIPITAVIGNDACWSQMYRDQVRLLFDDVATTLEYTPYEQVAEGFGQAFGACARSESELEAAIDGAFKATKEGKPACINVLIARSSFREGAISL